MEQLLEVFDAGNQPLGYTKPKAQIEQDGDWHRTAQVFVVSGHNELLVSLRHPTKKVLPNYWDVCVGGHTDPGEMYEEAALRETQEELGVRPGAGELQFVGYFRVEVTENQLLDREHAAVYVWKTSCGLNDFTMQPDEIAELRYMSIETVKRDLARDQPSLAYTPPRPTYYEMLCRVEKLLS
ncbi:hypothetical protein GCM10023187_05670 [Nibrella viscosa]|uniref:Nudix hydrolase domain-containing protein n=1 Tax=Nibrella viscosa TaxID=1084524 RepID=A0ABP8JW98_9BACT